MRKQGTGRRQLSARSIILLTFMMSMQVSILIIGHLLFAGWVAATSRTIESMASKVSEVVFDQVYSFMDAPYRINEANHGFMEDDILDLTDDVQRDRFLISVLDSQEKSLYGFSYVTADGRYYGARRNKMGDIEIIRNDSRTFGSS